jgi:hypothetical protein
MRVQEYLKREKEHYGSIYVDINYAIDSITPFLDKKNLEDRKYVSRLPVLKRYMELIESAENDTLKGGFLKLFGNDKYKDLLERYKRDNKLELEQLERCRECTCLNCTASCRFDGCLGCRNGAEVVKCDHGIMNVIFHKNFTLDLTNEGTGRDERYMVLATLQNLEKDVRYIIIEGISSKEKFVLYYYPGISEDTYGEITNESEFDYIVSTFESVER